MRMRALTTAILWLAGIGTAAAGQFLIDFEDLSLSGDGFTYGGPGTADDYEPESVFLASGSAGFRTTITRYSPDEYWSGFAFSNRGDTATGGSTNQYSSFAGGGSGGGGNFAIAYWQSYDPALIVLPAGTKPVSLQLVNTTYTALTMRDGDVHNFSAGAYGPGDFLSVTFSGHSAADGTGAEPAPSASCSPISKTAIRRSSLPGPRSTSRLWAMPGRSASILRRVTWVTLASTRRPTWPSTISPSRLSRSHRPGCCWPAGPSPGSVGVGGRGPPDTFRVVESGSRGFGESLTNSRWLQ